MKINLIALLTVVILASCTTTTFTTSELKGNYMSSMTNKRELTLKEEIAVFMSESEIPNNFEVISINRYTPLNIPILFPEKKQLKEKLLNRAVKKASEQRGNAVLIVDANYYKVIKY